MDITNGPEIVSEVETLKNFPGEHTPDPPNIIIKLMSTSFFMDGKIYYSLCPPLTLQLSRLLPLTKILNETLLRVQPN